jgi:thiamine pyrophosphokinase
MGTQKMSRCLIISAAPIGSYEPLSVYMNNIDYIICADGGYNHAKNLSLKPNIIIGDLDSIGELPKDIEILRFNKDKDDTDTMLAVKYGIEKGYKDFLIIGAIGGRLDHTFANFCTLHYIIKNGCTGFIADNFSEVHIMEKGEKKFKKRENYYISVFPFGAESACITEKGFKYSLDSFILKSENPIGVSNEFKDDIATINVEKGAIIIILSKK